MNAELKQKWLEALRSGKYQQGSGQLREVHYCEEWSDTYHCCLGVLADIAGAPLSLFEDDGFLGSGQSISTSSDNADHFGLGPQGNEGDPQYEADEPRSLTTLQRKLASMNDNRRSFAEIADWIEINVPAEQP